MANITTTLKTIRTAPHALSLAEVNALLVRQGDRAVTQHSINHLKDLGFVQESTRTPGKFFTVKTKRTEIDRMVGNTPAPATRTTPAPATRTTPAPAPARATRPVVDTNPANYSAVQKGILTALRSAAHGIKGEDLNLVALSNLETKGLVRKDKRDRNLSASAARWFVRKHARASVDQMLYGNGSSLARR